MKRILIIAVGLLLALIFGIRNAQADTDDVYAVPQDPPRQMLEGETGLFTVTDPLNGQLGSGGTIKTRHAPSRTLKIATIADQVGVNTNPGGVGRETYITLTLPISTEVWVHDNDPKEGELGWLFNSAPLPELADEWQLVGIFSGTVSIVSDDSGTILGYVFPTVPPTQQPELNCTGLDGMPEGLSTFLGEWHDLTIGYEGDALWFKVVEVGSDITFGPTTTATISTKVFPHDDYRGYVAQSPEGPWVTDNTKCERRAPGSPTGEQPIDEPVAQEKVFLPLVSK